MNIQEKIHEKFLEAINEYENEKMIKNGGFVQRTKAINIVKRKIKI